MTVCTDYDGGTFEKYLVPKGIYMMQKDKAIINWEPSIVEQFVPPQVVDKPGRLEEQCFEEHVESVTSFHNHLARSTPDEAHKLVLRAVLRSLEDGKVGMYSKFHTNAVYTKGYSHPDTIRLAYM
jgi:hypothetical protein